MDIIYVKYPMAGLAGGKDKGTKDSEIVFLHHWICMKGKGNNANKCV